MATADAINLEFMKTILPIILAGKLDGERLRVKPSDKLTYADKALATITRGSAVWAQITMTAVCRRPRSFFC